MASKDEHRYDDIINLPHHQSKTRPHMSNYDRAAQFSPFAALTGYGDAIRETERLTDKKIELSDLEVQDLNQKICLLRSHPGKHPVLSIIYFLPDKRKAGGRYVTVNGAFKYINEEEQTIVLQGDMKILIMDILKIELGEI